MATDTRSSLIDYATALVRRRGYSAFSYADLAEAVGIRKASIHHHFAAKEDLGATIVAVYTEEFMDRLAAIDAEARHCSAKLNAYASLYRDGLSAGQGCLCGVLASELAILPERVQAGVRRFFQLNLDWLERVLREGVAKRAVRSGVKPARDARTILSTLQGAMLVGLTVGGEQGFDEAASGLFAGIFIGPN